MQSKYTSATRHLSLSFSDLLDVLYKGYNLKYNAIALLLGVGPDVLSNLKTGKKRVSPAIMEQIERVVALAENAVEFGAKPGSVATMLEEFAYLITELSDPRHSMAANELTKKGLKRVFDTLTRKEKFSSEQIAILEERFDHFINRITRESLGGRPAGLKHKYTESHEPTTSSHWQRDSSLGNRPHLIRLGLTNAEAPFDVVIHEIGDLSQEGQSMLMTVDELRSFCSNGTSRVLIDSWDSDKDIVRITIVPRQTLPVRKTKPKPTEPSYQKIISSSPVPLHSGAIIGISKSRSKP